MARPSVPLLRQLGRELGGSSSLRASSPARIAALPRASSIVSPFRHLQRRNVQTRESAVRDRSFVGMSSVRGAVLFLATGVGLYFYFESEKEKLRLKKEADMANQKVGRPSIGGPLNLVDTNNQTFTEEDLLGKWTLMYFGFTHCPDICPEELDKMGDAVDLLLEKIGTGPQAKDRDVLPLFISVDPGRDTVDQVKKYMRDFHPRMIGLTGDYDQIKRACKSYRVYFSTPPNTKPGDDYLVDHSIFFYLMDPLGQFVDAFGKATTTQEVVQKTLKAMDAWDKAGGHVGAGLRPL